ncbi:MAG TPA: DUF2254 family protein, partial [Sphingomicrobium sp.]
IQLAVIGGDFIDPTVPVAFVTPKPTEKLAARIAKAFPVSRNRDFDQDPRFGMRVFAEIAVRALSPGVNDPGTAIDTLVAAQRALDAIGTDVESSRESVPGIVDLPLSFEDLVEELVLPIARDSARLFEVGVRLQSMLGSLAQQVPAARAFLAKLAHEALEQNRSAGLPDSNLTRIEQAYLASFGGAQGSAGTA